MVVRAGLTILAVSSYKGGVLLHVRRDILRDPRKHDHVVDGIGNSRVRECCIGESFERGLLTPDLNNSVQRLSHLLQR